MRQVCTRNSGTSILARCDELSQIWKPQFLAYLCLENFSTMYFYISLDEFKLPKNAEGQMKLSLWTQTQKFSQTIWKVLGQHSWLPGHFGGNTYSKKTITNFKLEASLKIPEPNSFITQVEAWRLKGRDLPTAAETRLQVSWFPVQCSFGGRNYWRNQKCLFFSHEYLIITLYKNKT